MISLLEDQSSSPENWGRENWIWRQSFVWGGLQNTFHLLLACWTKVQCPVLRQQASRHSLQQPQTTGQSSNRSFGSEGTWCEVRWRYTGTISGGCNCIKARAKKMGSMWPLQTRAVFRVAKPYVFSYISRLLLDHLQAARCIRLDGGITCPHQIVTPGGN